MSIGDSKFLLLKETFNAGNKLSIADICELLSINRTRAYSYLDRCKGEGIDLKEEKKGRTAYYSLNLPLDDKHLYAPISKKDILRYHILTLLSKRPMIAKELCPYLDDFYKKQQPEQKHNNDIHKTSLYYDAINEMLENGMLIKHRLSTSTGLKQKLYPSGSKYPLIIEVDIYSLTEVSKCQNQSRALRSIIEKINVLEGNNESLDDSCFWQYGRGHRYDDTISQCFKELMNNHFLDKVLKFDYNGKPYRFHTGMLVYCQDKDMLYLLGHKEGGHGNNIVKYPNIQNLSYIDKSNREYGKPVYREYLVNMFSISVETAEEVEIRLIKTQDNIRRLERLCALRINGKYRSDGKYLLYTDIVSGLNDLRNYLRSYGNECEIIKPESLKHDMKNTVDRTLAKYMEAPN